MPTTGSRRGSPRAERSGTTVGTVVNGSTAPEGSTPPDGSGPVALVGSGEFLDVMVGVDAGLLAGRPARVAVLPTAAGLEGDERVDWWLELARGHYEAMGVETVA